MIFIESIVITVIYGCICLFGTSGNTYVIARISYLLCTDRKQKNNSTKFIRVYLLGLSLIDLVSLLVIPIITTNLILDDWIFGEECCKISISVEGFVKFASSFLLAGLSIDRYFAVCKPVMWLNCKRSSVIKLVLAILLFCLVCFCGPLYYYSSEFFQTYSTNVSLQANDDYRTYNYSKISCYLSFDTVSENWVAMLIPISMFGIGFLFPGIVIGISYGCLLIRLQDRNRSTVSGRRRGYVTNTTRSVVRISCFYFCCWLPYWVFNISALFLPPINSVAISIIGVIIHALPFLNSSLNPIFYAILSQDLLRSKESFLDFIRRYSRTRLSEGIEMSVLPVRTSRERQRLLGSITPNQNGNYLHERRQRLACQHQTLVEVYATKNSV